MSMAGLLSAEALRPVLDKAASIREQIDAIDEQINQEQAGPRRVMNQAAEAVSDQLAEFVKQVRAQIDELFGADRVGAVVLLRRVVGDYQDEVKAYVDENVTTNDVELSVEEQTKLRAERKNLVDAHKGIRASMEIMAPDLLSDPVLAEIKNLKGAIGGSGSRGPRLKGAWRFVVDGKAIDGTTLGDVKTAVGVTAVSDVKAAFPSDFNWDASDDERSQFSFTVNGHEVTAIPGAGSDSGVEENGSDVDENAEVNDDVFGDADL